jgi:hypothetical protein
MMARRFSPNKANRPAARRTRVTRFTESWMTRGRRTGAPLRGPRFPETLYFADAIGQLHELGIQSDEK